MKIVAALLFWGSAALAAGGDLPHRGWSFSDLGAMPLQAGGRVKPLEAHARDLALFITGSRAYEGFSPVDLITSWIAAPQAWESVPFVLLTREDTKRQLGLEIKRKRFSPHELLQSALPQYASRLTPPASGQKPHPREQEIRTVMDRIAAYRSVTSGEAWTIVPRPFPEAWASLVGPPSAPVRKTFATLLHAYQDGRQADFEAAARLLRTQGEAQTPQWDEGVGSRVKAELVYLRSQPFFWAWLVYLLAALLWFASRTQPSLGRHAFLVTAVAMGIHAAGMIVRSYVAGRPPVSNMYESVVWVSFGVVFFAGILHFVQKQTTGLLVASILAAIGLILGDAAPAVLDASIKPLVPVLRSNFWLTIHVLTITLGYSAFALSMGVANVSLWRQAGFGFGFFARLRGGVAAAKGAGPAIAALNELSYRAVQFGVVLLAAGTILGGIWADYSWGRFWGWDPKEVWALIALLSYVVVLHGRLAGWMGTLGFSAWTIVAFASVVMAWYGVNFVLGVGLHSYGFATGGRGYVFGAVALQLVYVAACAARVRMARR